MDHYEEIKSLAKISENFRKSKKPKSKWPVEFQLRVLRLIESGYSPSVLSKKLNIPVQTYYHWRRVWKNHPKLAGSGFQEVIVSNKIENVDSKEGTEVSGAVIILSNGIRIENISADLLLKVLNAV